MNNHLHIVCLDVPYPVDYGGVFDLFYKIKEMHSLGVKIHLHCFDYGRGEQPELNKYCEEVFYYNRNEGHKGFSFKLPYIVASRNNPELWNRLQQDQHPVLLEGIHCTYGLHQGLLNNRKVILRLHNVEYEYYRQLSGWERSLVKKAYLHHESRLLERYEKQIANQATIYSVSEKDANHYRKKFGAREVEYLPVFIPGQMVTAKEGLGTFALYHGNLSVAENEKAATWLLEKVFDELEIPFVVAGKNPPKRLVDLAHERPHTCIVQNPSEAEMNDLITKAQVHVMPSFTSSGIKLKLLNALFNGRHIVTNEDMVKGTGLEKACHIADNPAMIKYTVYRLFHTAFTNDDKEMRQGLLQKHFNNKANAERLMHALQ
ncbi:MAG: glycosyltransferase family 4 protein [Lacibacter sp.]